MKLLFSDIPIPMVSFALIVFLQIQIILYAAAIPATVTVKRRVKVKK